MFISLICACLKEPCIDIWRTLNGIPANHHGTFDLCYKANKRDGCHSLTNGNRNGFGTGFQVYFQYYDKDGKPQGWTNLRSNGQRTWSVRGVYSIKFDSNEQEYSGDQEPYFAISNFYGSDLKFDLGVAIDVNYKSQGRSVKLIKNLNGDAVTMDGGSEKISFQLRKLTLSMLNYGDDYFGDVDTIYMGPTLSDTTLPFLRNHSVDETPAGQVSTLAFSWNNRIIPEGKVATYGFKVQSGTNFVLKPLIRDVTVYNPEMGLPKNYELKFNVTEYEKKEVTAKVVVTGNTGDDHECEKFTPTDDVHTKTIICPRTFDKDRKSLNYKAYAIVTSTNLRSPETRGVDIHIEGLNPPVFSATVDKTEINPSDTEITVTGTLEDEHAVYVYYQFDNLDTNPHFVKKFVTNPNIRNEPFSFKIPVPSGITLGQKYKLRIWGKDDNDFPSPESGPFDIIFKEATKPVVKDVYISENRIENNTNVKLVIYGTGLYSNPGQNATVWLRFNNGQEENIANFTGSHQPVTFAGFKDLDGQEVGDYNFTVYARAQGAPPEEEPASKATTTLYVWDPYAPQIQERIGQFVNTTDELGENSYALFNLKYKDIEEIPRNMSYMDQGFYCKFKTFNTSDKSNAPEYNFTHKNKGHISQDGFDIQLTIDTEPTTNFTEVRFNVSNSNYFERLFSLSLYVDSDLAGNESTIKKFARGIVVNSYDKYVRYTVFTKDYLEYTAPDMTFLGDNNTQSFFTDTKDESQTPQAYGFTWDQRKIPGKGYSIFAIAFAGYDKVKTPIRLIDSTAWKDHYDADDRTGKKISLEIENIDKNDEVYLKINENDHERDEKVEYNEREHKELPITFPATGDMYKISIYAIDKSPNAALPSNKIEKQIYLTDAPHLDVFDARDYYHDQETYKVQVLVSDKDAKGKIGIYYRYTNLDGNFLGAELHSADVDRGVNTTIEIPFTEIHADRNQKWKIEIYAKERNVVSNIVSHEFKLNPKSNPKLTKVGISKKSARPNENLLAFVVLNDSELDDLKIYVQIGSRDFDENMRPVQVVPHNPNPGKEVPIAFFWPVPSDIEAGVKEVWFLVRDSEGLPSDPMVKTLVIY